METQELIDFKNKWIGKDVIVTDPTHPHYKTVGEVTDVEYTFAGWGMKIKNTQQDSVFYGDEFFIFKGNQIKLL